MGNKECSQGTLQPETLHGLWHMKHPPGQFSVFCPEMICGSTPPRITRGFRTERNVLIQQRKLTQEHSVCYMEALSKWELVLCCVYILIFLNHLLISSVPFDPASVIFSTSAPITENSSSQINAVRLSSSHVNIFDSKVCHLFILVTQTHTVSVRVPQGKAYAGFKRKLKTKTQNLEERT